MSQVLGGSGALMHDPRGKTHEVAGLIARVTFASTPASVCIDLSGCTGTPLTLLEAQEPMRKASM